MDSVRIGTYQGTGAAINIELGWVPDHVRVVNTQDGDAVFDWFKGMGAGDVIQDVNDGTTQKSLVTSNGIDAYDGTSTTAAGFTVGTALSESGKTFRYVASRNAEGA